MARRVLRSAWSLVALVPFACTEPRDYNDETTSGGRGGGEAGASGSGGELSGAAGETASAGAGGVAGHLGAAGSAGESGSATNSGGSVGEGGATTRGGTTAQGGSSAGGSDAGATGVTECTEPDTACGSTCVDLATDPQHCGDCSHDCGAGAECESGVCLPAQLTPTATDVTGGVAVDTSQIYFSDGKTIASCPLAGCERAPKQVWSADYVRSVTAVGGVLSWVGLNDVGRTAIQRCDPASCTPSIVAAGNMLASVASPVITGKSLFYHQNTSGVPAYVADHIQCAALSTGGCSGMTSFVGKPLFATDGVSLVYVPTAQNSPNTFVTCPLDAASCTPVGLSATDGVQALSAFNRVLYMAWKGLVGPNMTRAIQQCALTGCTTATKIANTTRTQDVVAVAADASGVYWAHGGDQGSIWMCAPGGCPGGPRLVADAQANPAFLQLRGNFVYWGALGLSADAHAAGSFGLRRVAKPLLP